ncbi:MAG TPA: DUF4388 domain-containing protein [Fredinandcohnia sp.]|nr:DUF4388 domain-containing protein [Fredinandcohnia sp.]
MLALQGSFAFLGCAELFRLLAEKKATGALFARRGADEKRLGIEQGRLTSATSNDPREYLGRLLIDAGHISESDFLQAHRTHLETGVPLGKILVMTGVLSEEVVQKVLRDKFRETALGIFTWDEGSFAFHLHERRRAEAEHPLPVALSLVELAQEGEAKRRAMPVVPPPEPSGRSTAEWFPTATADLKGGGQPSALKLAREALTEGDAERALEILEAAGQDLPVADVRALRKTAEDRLLTLLRAELLQNHLKPVLVVDRGAVRAMPLTPPERFLLYRMDGVRDIEELVQTAPLRQIDALRLIRRLHGEGVIRY